MQNAHKGRLDNDPKYRAHMDGLYCQFKLLFANFLDVADLVSSRKGGIVFEWPTCNRLWQEKEVIEMLKKYGLQKVSFNGCRFELRSQKGVLICKPWTFATNTQAVVDKFKPMRCTRDHV